MDFFRLERVAEREDPGPLLGYACRALADVADGRWAMRAVRHPLGFHCLPLLRDGGHGACVHVFRGADCRSGPEERLAGPTTSRLHAHSWQLTSLVLHGRLGNVPLEVRDRPDRPTHRVYEVISSPAGTDEIRPTSRLVTCVPGATAFVGAANFYALPAGEFHTTVVPGAAGAVTLALGRSVPRTADLSLGPLDGGIHRVERRTCEAAQTTRIARDVLRRIDVRNDRG